MKYLTLILLIHLLSPVTIYAGNWYVDNAATGTGNGTSLVNAWPSFHNIVWGTNGVSAGDTLYISGGAESKQYNETLIIGASGLSNSLINIRVVQVAGHNGTVIIDGGSGLRTEGINATSSQYFSIDGSVNGTPKLTIQNVTHSSNKDIGFALNCQSGTGSIVESVIVNNCNNGIKLGAGTNMIVRKCSLSGIRGDRGIDMNGCTGGWDANLIYGNFISNNTTSNRSGVGPDGIQATSGVSIYDNYFVGIGNDNIVNGQHPDAIQGTRKYFKIYRNTFENFTDSCIDYDNWDNGNAPSDWIIYNNIFKITDQAFLKNDRNPVAIRVYKSGGGTISSLTNFIIANNTFVDYCNSTTIFFQWAGGNPTATNTQIVNNIFYNCGKSAGSASVISIQASSSFTFTNWNIDYNIFYSGAHGDNYINFEGINYRPTSWGVSTLQAHGVSSAPTFVSYTETSTSNNLRLAASDNAAKDSGINLSSIFSSDMDLVSRPQGSAWDIGAYEFQTGPIAPSNVKTSITTL